MVCGIEEFTLQLCVTYMVNTSHKFPCMGSGVLAHRFDRQ